jgi:hypothetical protein
MRFDLLLLGRTSGGQRCEARVSVFANSQAALQEEAHKAAENGPWHLADNPAELVAESETITVERVKLLREPE